MSREVDYLYHGNTGDDDPAEWYAHYYPGIGVDSTVTENTGLRWEYQTRRDERLFRAAHFELFRAQWRQDLARQRWQNRAQMEGIECGS
jgi:hypothetical protein